MNYRVDYTTKSQQIQAKPQNGGFLVEEKWYQALVDDCRAIITEAVFTSRWALVEGYWNLGKRIREDINFQEYSKGNKKSVQDLARNLNISERTLYYALQLYDKYPDINQIPEGKNITWNKLITKYLPGPKIEEVNIELPKGKYNVIYADPPWKYEHPPMGDSNRSIERHYPTLELEKIKSMQIPAAEDSVLFIWATAPKLAEVIEVINAWGFNYRTCCIWDKKIIGMGYWFRNRHELLLVATKGDFPPPPVESRPPSVYEERRGEHSRKPDYFYQMIEKMYPNGKYLELFARRKWNDKWTVWGNEI